MRVKLSSMPDPKSVSSVTLQNLYGGLNLRDDPVNVGKSQSPDMVNLWYEDGVLRKRPGLTEVFPALGDGSTDGTTWFYDKLFNGLAVYVDGTAIRYFDPSQSTPERRTVSGTKIPDGTPHGTFFTFDERLYYKAQDVYLRLSYQGGTLSAENLLYKEGDGYMISDGVYTPIISINRNPDGSGGDGYQPENRINPNKQVWFDVDANSYAYYLPVHGCTVTKIRVDDDEVDTTGVSRTYTIAGRDVEIINEQIPDTSAEYTYLKFSVPLYVDEDGWHAQPWLNGDTSLGRNYISNVVYSNFPLPATENTAFIGGTMLHPADSIAVPPEYSTTFLNTALGMCGYDDKSRVFVNDNGKYCNVFILSPSFKVEKYNAENTEMWMSNYFRVSYNYTTGKWTTYDFTGKTNNGWHYAKNAVYATVDVYFGEQKIIAAGGPTGSHTTFTESFQDIAFRYSGLTSSDTYKLLWISANENIVVFHYLVGSNRFYVTNYDSKNEWFQGKGIRKVTIHRADISQVDVQDMTEPGKFGFYVKNIVWASENIIWNHYVPGDIILPAGGDLTDQYKKLAEIALYRAKRDYPNANITGNYAIAAKGNYVSVYVDFGMQLKEYNIETGEFKASNFVSEVYVRDDEKDKITLDTTTPATMSNKLRVTYYKENPDAMKAIADCRFSTTYGGTDAACAVLGGCSAQPNAIFWSGNGSSGVDATYFPMDQYNLCGTYQDPVTGFGKQQSALVVFQRNHTSRASYGISEIGGRKYIDLTMTTINAERGCDRPWSIALCGNNLCWMSSRYGVMYLKETSAAYENMIVNISSNVDGSTARPGALQDIRKGDESHCMGVEDGKRYYAFTGSGLYVWDYGITSVGNDGITGLSWTRHSGMEQSSIPIEAALDATPYGLFLLTKTGAVLKLDPNAKDDLGTPIPCRYTTPMQNFDGYYRLRNITKAIVSLRIPETGTVDIGYRGESIHTEQAVMLRGQPLPTPVILRPRGLHVSHFQMSVSTDGSDGGIEIMGVTILHTAQGNTK